MRWVESKTKNGKKKKEEKATFIDINLIKIVISN